MSTITNGVTDTPISGATAPTLTAPVLNYASDFRIKKQDKNNTYLINTSSPLDQPETLRFGFQEVNDAYSGSGLNSDQIPGSKKGMNILIQLSDTYKVTDSTNTAVIKYLPVSTHLVIKAPQAAEINATLIKGAITRLLGALYEDGALNIEALLRGVIVPKDL